MPNVRGVISSRNCSRWESPTTMRPTEPERPSAHYLSPSDRRLATGGIPRSLASGAGPQPQPSCGSHSGPLGWLASYYLMVGSPLAGPSPLGWLASYCESYTTTLRLTSPLSIAS